MLSFSLSPSPGNSVHFSPLPLCWPAARYRSTHPTASAGLPRHSQDTCLHPPELGIRLPLPCRNFWGPIPSSVTPYTSPCEIWKLWGTCGRFGKVLEDCHGFGNVQGAPIILAELHCSSGSRYYSCYELSHLFDDKIEKSPKNWSKETHLEGRLGCCAMMLQDSPFCSSSSWRISVAFLTQPGHNS